MENSDQILDAPVQSEMQVRAYAGFWIRFAAYLVDGILLGIVNFVVGLAAIRLGGLESSVFSLVIGFLYFALMESSERQATLGKTLVGIKVGDINGARLSFANATGRYFAKILSALMLCIGFMMAGWDPKKQGLHDKLADTYVYYV